MSFLNTEMKHELTPPPDHTEEESTPIVSALIGTIEVLTIPGSYENDLLQFLTHVKPQIDVLVSENVNQTARNLHFIEKIEPSKPTNGEKVSLSFIQTWNPSMIERYLKRIFL